MLYVGTYTEPADDGKEIVPAGQGIYVFELDMDRRQALFRQVLNETRNPSFLAAEGSRLYACGEREDCAHAAAYRREKDGTLTFINSVDGEGAGSCHGVLCPDRRLLLVSNYVSGSVTAFSLAPDGSILGPKAVRHHHGRGSNLSRQESAHVHSAAVFPGGDYAAVADLGLDAVFLYGLDMEEDEKGRDVFCEEERGAEGKTVKWQARSQVRTAAGEGPRHMVFSGDGRHVYLVTELGNHLVHFTCGRGPWQMRESLELLPKGYERTPWTLAADVHMTKDGKFLYVSCRGYDKIAAFGVDKDGTPRHRGSFGCGGRGPRNFCISPDERWIAVANQYTGNVAVLPRNTVTGEPGEPVMEIAVPQAVCVVWTEDEKEESR